VRGLDALIVQCTRDIGQPTAARVLETNSVDDTRRELGWTPRRTATDARAGRLEVFADEVFEFGDRDEPLSPRRLDRVHGGDDAAVDRRDADAEGFGGLFAGVCEPVGFVDFSQPARRRPNARGPGRRVA
jgi:hypothetical protein